MRKPLIIDPVLNYSTYVGGSNVDISSGIAVDTSGNAYMTGFTRSPNFPTKNPLQPIFGGGFEDAFVTKVDPTGSTLVYSTYLGGNDFDSGNGIAVDTSGNAYVIGETASTDFPTKNPLQSTHGSGYEDAFVAKVDPTGSTLVYSTYLGGNRFDSGSGIAVDTSGNVYVTGRTDSKNFPIKNPLQPTLGGIIEADAFVTKVNPTGSALVYSTYLGGNWFDEGSGIAVDTSGSAYVTGETFSINFPTKNPLQPFSGGSWDAFVAKISNGDPFKMFFATRAEIALIPWANRDRFKIRSLFMLKYRKSKIDPLTEDVSFTIGTFSTTIPAGAFTQDLYGRFVFEGVINGVILKAEIEPIIERVFAFNAKGKHANLAGTVNPVDVVLTIGNDTGSTTVTAVFE